MVVGVAEEEEALEGVVVDLEVGVAVEEEASGGVVVDLIDSGMSVVSIAYCSMTD